MGSRTTFWTSWVENTAIMVYASHIFLRKGTIWKKSEFSSTAQCNWWADVIMWFKIMWYPKIEFYYRKLVTLNSASSDTIRNWIFRPMQELKQHTQFQERITSTGSSIFWLPRSLQPQRVIQGTKTSQLNNSDTLVGWVEIEMSCSTCSLKIQIYNHSMMIVILLTVFAQ